MKRAATTRAVLNPSVTVQEPCASARLPLSAAVRTTLAGPPSASVQPSMCTGFPGRKPVGLNRLDQVTLAKGLELLCHASIEMTMRYAHLTPNVRRDAVQLLDVQARGTSLAPDVGAEKGPAETGPWTEREGGFGPAGTGSASSATGRATLRQTLFPQHFPACLDSARVCIRPRRSSKSVKAAACPWRLVHGLHMRRVTFGRGRL